MPKVAQRPLFSDPAAAEGEPSRRRAAGYIRVSTKHQAEEGLGLQVQREAIEAYCGEHDLDLIHIYEDAGTSGSTGVRERSGWGSLSLGLDVKDFSVVVVLRLDRFSRDARDQANMLYDLERQGVQVVSIREPEGDGDEETRTLLRGILAHFAQYEKDKMIARLRAGRNAKRKNGGYAGGWVPYGYRMWGKGRAAHLVASEREASVVRAIFEARASGLSTCRIANKLLAREEPTKRGGRWSPETIRVILKNPHYMGRDRKGNPNGHPAIVDPELWERAQ